MARAGTRGGRRRAGGEAVALRFRLVAGALVAAGILALPWHRGLAQPTSSPPPKAPKGSTEAASTADGGAAPHDPDVEGASRSVAGSEPDDAGAPAASDPPGGPDAAALEQARQLFHEGNELRRAGNCQGALELYRRSRALVPSVPNTWNAAVCLDTLGRFDEALDTYELLLREFRQSLSEADRLEIRNALDQLRGQMGRLDLQASVDGSLVVDGRMRGRLPLTGPLHLLPGKHTVQVMKEGYGTFEAEVQVAVGETARLTARLEVLASAGRLRIDAPEAQELDLFVDGAPVGRVPWEGSLEAGEHVLYLRGPTHGSAPQLVTVVKGQLVRPVVAVGKLGPELRLSVRPRSADINLSEVRVGRGQWVGRLPVGEYRFEAREEGYFSAARALTVELERADDAELELRADAEHPRWGSQALGQGFLEAMGAFALAPNLGSGAERSCDEDRCRANPWAFGWLVGARGGYEFPVGLSIVAAAGYLSLSKKVERHFDDSFQVGGTAVQTHYELQDSLRVHGPFAGAGIGYRLGLAGVVELRANLLLGALFAFSHDEVAGTASAGNRSVPASVDGSGEVVSSADLFVLPELGLGLRFDGFAVGAGLGALVLALEGPALPTGDVRVAVTGCGASPTAIDCAPGEAMIAAEPAYGATVVLLPELTVGYWF